jgi:MFS transporter, YNFM family, putative membrane transport protein
VFAPIRSIYALRANAPVAVLFASAAVTAMFTATPFLIPELADGFDVSAGRAGLVSVVQVGAFAIATMVAGRRLPVTAASLRWSVIGLGLLAVASAYAPSFPVLLALRAAAGSAGGAVTALIWADAMREPARMGGVSVIGPATALIGGLGFGLVAAPLGYRGMYIVLAAVCIPGAALSAELAAVEGERIRPSRSRSNRVLLLGLFLLTLSGASLFVYEAVIAADAGIAAWVVAVGFSMNAAGGLIGARLERLTRRPGMWLAATGAGALITVVPGGAVAFLAGMTWWGMAFWMGLPGVMRMLSARSLEPGERAGDAQGWMAFGRALGPLAGAPFVDGAAFTALAVTAASGLVVAGAVITGVQWGRAVLPATTPLHRR